MVEGGRLEPGRSALRSRGFESLVLRRSRVDVGGARNDAPMIDSSSPFYAFNRHYLARDRAVAIAVAYEQHRGAHVTDIGKAPSGPVASVFADLGLGRPTHGSADLISQLEREIRVIEIKGRGGIGPLKGPERELTTMREAGPHSWLYAVGHTTSRGAAYELWLVQDPGHRLTWTEVEPAQRPAGTARGAGHEAKLQCEWDDVTEHGTKVDLSRVPNLPPKD